MRFMSASLLMGSLAIIVGPLATGQSAATGSSPAVQSAAVGSAAADKETYTRKAKDDVQEWEQKLHKFSVKVEAGGRHDVSASEHDLNEAWDKTKAEANKLQTASDDDWVSAKASYEKAIRDLAIEWNRIRPEDK